MAFFPNGRAKYRFVSFGGSRKDAWRVICVCKHGICHTEHAGRHGEGHCGCGLVFYKNAVAVA